LIENYFNTIEGATMQSKKVCPFFRKGDDFCDVGCGYISPHDVRIMVTNCNCRYAECSKYQELAARFPHEALTGVAAPEDRALPRARLPHFAGTATGKPLIPPFKAKWPLPFHVRFVSAGFDQHPFTIKEAKMKQENTLSKGWTVVLAGTGINLALGILYAYSMLKGDIDKLFSGSGDPYAVACLAFAASMILGGKAQDKIGPRITAIIGGLLVGAGFIVCSQTSSYWGWVLGFGVLSGLGFGFGYSAATPPALKWFPPAKTGLIAGIVVSGFGIAPVYLAPTCQYLLGAYGLHNTMLILGIAFIAIVCGMALLVTNPPAGFVPAGSAPVAGAKKSAVPDKTPREVLRDSRLYTLWITFFIGAGAGLMVIGSVAGIAKKSMGEYAFIAVAVMAIGNAAGRIVAGTLSDKIGRGNTLLVMMVSQAILMFAAIPVVGSSGANAIVVTLLATFIGFNYGSNLSLFPSFAKDFWGTKNYGMNYGVLFTAWGIGAFVLVKVSQSLNAKFGSFTVSFAAAGVLLLVGAMLSLSLRQAKVAVAEKATVPAAFEEEDLVLQKAD
jgi:MFS transporter, OFA family, oxalate/formate antiporter